MNDHDNEELVLFVFLDQHTLVVSMLLEVFLLSSGQNVLPPSSWG